MQSHVQAVVRGLAFLLELQDLPTLAKYSSNNGKCMFLQTLPGSTSRTLLKDNSGQATAGSPALQASMIPTNTDLLGHDCTGIACPAVHGPLLLLELSGLSLIP